jgi:hypothetical protein
MAEALFHSSVRFERDPGWFALAVYCSDGRFASACEQFLTQHFAGRCSDRFVLPGGPAALVHDAEQAHHLKRMRFLVEAHHLSRVLLIAHDGCRYYHDVLGVAEGAIPAKQTEDLQSARALIETHMPGPAVETYRAVIDGNRVAIQRVAAAGG